MTVTWSKLTVERRLDCCEPTAAATLLLWLQAMTYQSRDPGLTLLDHGENRWGDGRRLPWWPTKVDESVGDGRWKERLTCSVTTTGPELPAFSSQFFFSFLFSPFCQQLPL